MPPLNTYVFKNISKNIEITIRVYGSIELAKNHLALIVKKPNNFKLKTPNYG